MRDWVKCFWQLKSVSSESVWRIIQGHTNVLIPCYSFSSSVKTMQETEMRMLFRDWGILKVMGLFSSTQEIQASDKLYNKASDGAKSAALTMSINREVVCRTVLFTSSVNKRRDVPATPIYLISTAISTQNCFMYVCWRKV